MKKRYLSLVCVIAFLLSISGVNVQASEELTMIDGSYLTHEEESVGEAVLIMRGEDLQTGTSKVSKASSTAINAGGTTTAYHVVDDIGNAVGDGVEDVGEGVKDATDDLTGNDTTADDNSMNSATDGRAN